MDAHVIYLDEDDDIVSISDRLDWIKAQQLLLVLPENGGVLREGLDLVRLRRHADQLRLEVGLVTPDTEIRRQAGALGFPTFTTVAAGQKSRRGWWRGRRRRENVGLSTVGGVPLSALRPSSMDEGNRREIRRRMTRPATWRRWLLRYAAILFFFATLAFLFVAFSYTVPAATLTLKPEVRPIRATRQIVADPALEAIDYAQAAVPGRLLTVTQSWQTDVTTTGIIEVPNAPARGQVVFVNRLAQEVAVPAGTRVSTSAGETIVYQTSESITVAGAVGSTAEAEIIAVEPGPQGNVEANLINRVEGSLSLQLDVRNLEPITGGGVRQAAAVTEADQARLRSQVLQFLQAVATSEMEAQLTEREFLAQDSLRVVEIHSETYSHAVGEQTERLTVEMRASLSGTAINTTEAAGLVYESLAAEVPDDFSLVPPSITISRGDVLGVDDQGRVTFMMVGEGVVSAELDLDQPIAAITGQKPATAIAYLYDHLPLRDVPTVDIWPVWFDRIPYLPTRIQTDILVEG